MYTAETELFVAPDQPVLTIVIATGAWTSPVELDFEIGDWFSLQPAVHWRVIEKFSTTAGIVQFPTGLPGTAVTLTQIRKYQPEGFTPRLALMHLDGGSLANFSIFNGITNQATSLTANSFVATWFSRLRWEELAANHYAGILNALATPMIVKAHFNLSVLDFIQLDHLRPIYIDQLNAFFYLNLVEQFKLNNKTRLELIRISTLTDNPLS